MATHTHARRFGHDVEISLGGLGRFWMWAAMLAAAAALVVGVFLFATRPMSVTRSDSGRALAADTARQNGLAAFYLSRPRATSAQTTRLAANTEAYLAVQVSRQRALTADAARYSTLAEFYERTWQTTRKSQQAFDADRVNLEAMAGRKSSGFATLAEFNASMRGSMGRPSITIGR